MFTFFNRSLSIQFDLRTPMLRWSYNYPSLIHRGANVCGHSAIYRKLIAVEWVSDEQKKCKLQKHKLTVISTTCTCLGCFLMWHSLVDQIAHGKCDYRTVILTRMFYRSLVSESSVTGVGGPVVPRSRSTHHRCPWVPLTLPRCGGRVTPGSLVTIQEQEYPPAKNNKRPI